MTKNVNRLVGHELPLEGHIPCTEGGPNGPGRTHCTCGKLSPELPSTRARKRWHREHKDQVREEMDLL